MKIKNYHLAGLILLALFLLGIAIFSSIQTALKNPAGKILDGKDYGYQASTLTDSIFVYTGSTILLSGSGKIIQPTNPIVTEIKYSSGSALMHRKIAISSGQLVTEKEHFFKIYLASGAIIYDTMNDDGSNGLFTSINRQGQIQIFSGSEVTLSGEGEWDYAPEGQIEVRFKTKDAQGQPIQKIVLVSADELETDDPQNIKIHLETGTQITEKETVAVTTEKTPEKFANASPTSGNQNTPSSSDNSNAQNPATTSENQTTSNPNNSDSSNPNDSNNSNSNSNNSNDLDSPTDTNSNETNPTTNSNPTVTTPDNPTTTDNQSPTTPTNPSNNDSNSQPSDNSDTLYWGEYPDTDEGNYDLATDKLNPNYCDRIEDGFLRGTCKETILEALGKCDLLGDNEKQLICRNNQIKRQAVEYERVSKCTEIKNDSDLFNTCINEVNQSLYNSAIEAGDANICKAIYSAEMIKKCKEALGVFE